MANGLTGTPSQKLLALLAALLFSTALAAYALKPTERIADKKPKIELDKQIPKQFGDWKEDSTVVPVLPNPEIQASLDALYSSTLARTYKNAHGQRVMLSIAYGSDQSSEATAVHRPEFCYSAQGFKVTTLGPAVLPLGQRKLQVQQLVSVLGQRFEPITYWITLDETSTLPGLSRKMAQIRYGLNNKIPDGLLFRVSTVGLNQDASFVLQQQFLSDLSQSMSPTVVSRYFGS
jgi:EpsI family protein